MLSFFGELVAVVLIKRFISFDFLLKLCEIDNLYKIGILIPAFFMIALTLIIFGLIGYSIYLIINKAEI